MEYHPEVGDFITVELPDERTRAQIEKVVSDTACIAKLLTFTTAKTSHNYRKGDMIACRFGKVGMNLTGWSVVSDRQMQEAEDAQAAKQKQEASALADDPAHPQRKKRRNVG